MTVLLQQPDSARARPSTLLEDDDSYDKLFHENTSLNTYFTIATWGRAVEERLKEIKKYETAESSDIKFYVLYYAVCVKINNLYPSNKKIEDIASADLLESDVDSAIGACYDIYKELGGNDKVAKGSEYLEKIKEKLKVTQRNA